MAKYTIGDIFNGAYPISQYYGNNPDYYKQFGFNGHEGIDFATPVGVEVLAPFNRNVILQDQDDPKSGAYGDYIVVWDPEQHCAVWFCHLSVNNVELGKEYPKGTVLGKTGNTGNSTGPHLHFNFVETDANGVRQNLNNGFKGMLNALDGNLLEWKLGNQSHPVVQQPAGTITIATTERDMLVGKASKYDDFVNNGYDSVDKVKDEIKKREDTISNLNTQITKLQSEHSTKDTDITSLKAQVTTLTTELESLRPQVAKLVETNKLYAQLQESAQADKLRWQMAETKYRQQIAGLTGTSYTSAPNGILWNQLLKNIFHIS